mmetsp:Transcript_23862/g.69916  ORF Transcript_23862/g.69916 Transcript_23862/m.69916 type:complete len:368 (-) Transcript_23862:1186-2289(-)
MRWSELISRMSRRQLSGVAEDALKPRNLTQGNSSSAEMVSLPQTVDMRSKTEKRRRWAARGMSLKPRRIAWRYGTRCPRSSRSTLSRTYFFTLSFVTSSPPSSSSKDKYKQSTSSHASTARQDRASVGEKASSSCKLVEMLVPRRRARKRIGWNLAGTGISSKMALAMTRPTASNMPDISCPSLVALAGKNVGHSASGSDSKRRQSPLVRAAKNTVNISLVKPPASIPASSWKRTESLRRRYDLSRRFENSIRTVSTIDARATRMCHRPSFVRRSSSQTCLSASTLSFFTSSSSAAAASPAGPKELEEETRVKRGWCSAVEAEGRFGVPPKQLPRRSLRSSACGVPCGNEGMGDDPADGTHSRRVTA